MWAGIKDHGPHQGGLNQLLLNTILYWWLARPPGHGKNALLPMPDHEYRNLFWNFSRTGTQNILHSSHCIAQENIQLLTNLRWHVGSGADQDSALVHVATAEPFILKPSSQENLAVCWKVSPVSIVLPFWGVPGSGHSATAESQNIQVNPKCSSQQEQ